MAYDYEKGVFLPTLHEMWDTQVVPMAGELKPGDVYYVAAEHVLVDGSPQKHSWVYRYATLLKPEDVLEELLDDFDCADEMPPFVRLICVNEGIIADFSHTNQISWEDTEDKFNRLGAEAVNRSPEAFLPIIHRVHNYEELCVIETALANNNISLNDTDFEDIFDEFSDVVQIQNGTRNDEEGLSEDDEDDLEA